MKLNRLDNILINLDEVQLLIGSAVVMKDGKMYDVGVKAADAIRSVFTPAEERLREQLKGTRDKAQALSPSNSQCATAAITIISMILFVALAFYGLFGLHDESELNREVEYADRSCEDCGRDRLTAVIVPANEINEYKQKVDVGANDDRPLTQEVAAEYQSVFDDDIRNMRSDDRVYLIPFHDDLNKDPNRRYKSDNQLDRRIVDVHKNILLCLLLLFTMLLPVILNNIIPKND